MNYQRIQSTIDVQAMQASHITIIGGAYGLGYDLVRCGAGAISMIDFDHVDATNPARQDLNTVDIGRAKLEPVAAKMKEINPDVEVETYLTDFCAMPQSQLEELLGQSDLIIDAADSFPVHARVNQLVQHISTPALWIGMYQGGRAGELVYWVPGLTPACYRCICGDRYRAFHSGAARITSDGGTILDLHLVDAIAGQIAVGILTRGADNRMGRLIDALGNRNLLQIKIDPEYRLGERDIFADYLGDHPANFSFTTIALPMDQESDCPDCRRQPIAAEEAL